MGYRVGEQAGPYKVLKLLGRGNFGEVLLAQDLRQSRHHIALKTVACDHLADDEAERARQNALREAQLLIRLRHPYIVGCEQVQWDTERRVVWFALEFMDGGDVQGLIDKRRESGHPPFEGHFVRRFFAAVGSALQYVHAEGVLHRDVKPANVLLARRSQRIKLGDFGISKLLESTGRARTVIGTPYYLAPEIVSGQTYGPLADAWALGICLYELAALRRPFEASNPLALVRRICEKSPDELPEDTAPDIRQAILGLLTRDQQQRMVISDALEVSDAIAALSVSPITSGCSSFAGKEALQGDASQRQSTWDLSRTSQAHSGEVSPISAVSLAASESGCSSCPCEAELVASLCMPLQEGAMELEHTLEPTAFEQAQSNVPRRLPTVPSSWQGGDAIAQAQVALSSDVDDPEELKLALEALEQNAESQIIVAAGAFEALQAELRLRLSALRKDAASFLESFLEPTLPGPAEPVAALPFRLRGPAPGWHVVASADAASEVASFVTAANMTVAEDVTALETAIEEASCLGLDTSLAEEHAASHRGLLTLRVAWGSIFRCCLVPIGMPFFAIVQEVSCRFRLEVAAHFKAAVGDPPPFKLSWHNGVEVHPLRDQATWETCLQRSGLQGRPGRLNLDLEVPFVITGTRVPSPCTGRSAMHINASGVRSAAPKRMIPIRSERHSGRVSLHGAAVQSRGAGGGGGGVVPLPAGAVVRPAQVRSRCGASGLPPTSALQLQGRSAVPARSSGQARQRP